MLYIHRSSDKAKDGYIRDRLQQNLSVFRFSIASCKHTYFALRNEPTTLYQCFVLYVLAAKYLFSEKNNERENNDISIRSLYSFLNAIMLFFSS